MIKTILTAISALLIISTPCVAKKRIVSVSEPYSSTWLTDTSQEASLNKISALRTALSVTQTPTVEDHATYVFNIVNDTDNAVWPVGPKSCLSSASALYTDIKEALADNTSYNLKIENTGWNGIPRVHYTVKMDPADGIGPSIIMDRYSGVNTFVVETVYTTKKMRNPVTGIKRKSVVYITTKLEDPAATFDEWEAIVGPIVPHVPVNCLLNDPVNGHECSIDATNVVVLPGLMQDIEAAKDSLDSAVYSVPDGHPCGTGISKTYHPNGCSSNLGACSGIQGDLGMGCDWADDYGIDYLSRCVWDKDYVNLTHYYIAYQETDGIQICE